MTEYAAHIASTQWRNFRLLVLQRDEQRCVLCNGDEALEVHHRTYERLGEELLSDCYTLCQVCHLMVTDQQRRLRYEKKTLPPFGNVAATTPNNGSMQWNERQKDISFETANQVPTYWGSASPATQWHARRPVEPLEQRAEENQRQTDEDGRRP